MKRFEWLVQNRTYAFGFLALFFYLWGLGGWELSAPDEPRYALVAQEMMQTGDFLFPHRNQVPYPDKPPLFFWGIAAASYFQGGEVTAFSSRLPSALAGLGCLLILGAWSSQRGKNPQMGFWTVAVLATSFRFFFQAHMAQIDMTLCLITTAATLYGFRSFEGRPVRRWFLGVLLGLGILAKGPVGYLIPAGIWALYCLFSGRTSWKFYPAKALLWGLVPPLIWLIGLGTEVAIRGEWAYFENLVFKQTLVRYVNPWHHYKPFYYFVQVFFQDFFPWSFFVVLLIPFRRELIAHLSDRQRLAWSAILFVLVFFSLSKGKRNLYILPMYPFAAYLVGEAFSRLTTLKGERWVRLVCLLICGVVGAALLAISAHWWVPAKLAEIPLVFPFWLPLLLAIGLCGTALWGLIWLFEDKSSRLALMGCLLWINLVLYQFALPWISPVRSAKTFMDHTVQAMRCSDQPERALGMVDFREAYRLFGDRKVVELTTASPTKDNPKLFGIPNLVEFWAEHPQGWVIVRELQLQEYRDLVPELPPIRIVWEQVVSEDRLFVIEQIQPTGPDSEDSQ